MGAQSLWEQIEPLLDHVERPSRYLNHEYNAFDGVGGARDAVATGDTTTHATPVPAPTGVGAAASAVAPLAPQGDAPVVAPYRAALLYPDTYELGQSNQAIAILYHLINGLDGCAAERVYLPWVDMIALMRQKAIPLFTLESTDPVASFDLLGITLPHELAATNILEALDLAGIPLKAVDRTQAHPLVVGGGPCAFNPEPVAAFFDVIVIGEGEDVTPELIAAHRACMARHATRDELLATLATIDGVYVPSLYELDTHGVLVPRVPNAPHTVRKRVIADFDACPVVTNPVVPFAEVVHDRLTVEVLRGCTRGCRFCQAGMLYRPVRERTVDTIIDAVARGLANTGYEEVSLTSLSTTDHSQIEQILRR
ncbi:MAG: radical SAM protein, partial [Coriobacteriales bacterium]|nr:radical SAM protein [Coriobacteriales bacterium]